jgi:hypothetical protein
VFQYRGVCIYVYLLCYKRKYIHVEKLSPKYDKSGTIRTVTQPIKLNILPEIRINYTSDKVMSERKTDTGKNTT